MFGMMKDRSSPSNRRQEIEQLQGSLRRRFPSATFQGANPLSFQPTGLAGFDSLLPRGGLPGGRISLICGPPSSGRASIALAIAATPTNTGNHIAWIDTQGTFHPPSAAAAGLDLQRVLMIRPPPGDISEALHAAILTLRSGALSLLVMDLGAGDDPLGSVGRRRPHKLCESAAARLGRSVPGASRCLILSDAPPPPLLFRIATLCIRLERTGLFWSDEGPRVTPARESGYDASSQAIMTPKMENLGPRTFQGVAIDATLIRSRLGGEGRKARLTLARKQAALGQFSGNGHG